MELAKQEPRQDSLFLDLIGSFRHPEFWSFAAWLDIVSKYRRSKLGVFWMFFPPMATFGMLGYFYAGIIGRPPLEFIPYMGLGYALWRFVTQVIGESSGAMLANRPFIMDGRTRLTDYVLKSISKAALYFICAFIVLIAVMSISPVFEPIGLLALFISMPILLWNLLCLGVVLGLLGARFPDMQEFTTAVFIFGFLLTPILWYPENLQAGSVRWQFMLLNPAYHFIELIRAPLLGRPFEIWSVAYISLTTFLGSTLAAFLYRRYARFVPIWI